MFLIGEKRLLRLIGVGLNGKTGFVEFRRGAILGKLIIDPYDDVLGFTLEIRDNGVKEIVEELYFDVEVLLNKYNILKVLQDKLFKYYRLCEIGLAIQFRSWENSLPKNTTAEQIMEYFDIDGLDWIGAKREESKYGKISIEVKGMYYGEKILRFLSSPKTGYITHILDIKEVC